MLTPILRVGELSPAAVFVDSDASAGAPGSGADAQPNRRMKLIEQISATDKSNLKIENFMRLVSPAEIQVNEKNGIKIYNSNYI